MKKNWRFHHFAVVTSDMDKAIDYYESCGIGPFEPESTDVDDLLATLDIERYGGAPADPSEPAEVRIRTINLDPLPIKIEFFQPVKGKSDIQEFFDKHGEGVNHIAFWVDDLEKEVAELVEKGYPLVTKAKFSDGRLAFVYFDTRKYGNLQLELMQAPKE